MTEGVHLSFTDADYVEMTKSIQSVINSCDEALDGSWDRSDDGFAAMSEELQAVINNLESARLKCGF